VQIGSLRIQKKGNQIDKKPKPEKDPTQTGRVSDQKLVKVFPRSSSGTSSRIVVGKEGKNSEEKEINTLAEIINFVSD